LKLVKLEEKEVKMKHELKIILVLLSMFIFTQLIGLIIIDAYSPHTITLPTGATITKTNPIPYGMQPPEMEPNISLMTILISLTIAIALMLILMKFRSRILIKLWFTLVIFITLSISMNAVFLKIFPDSALRFDIIALAVSLPLTFFKVFRRDMLVHNLTELFVYPGLAVLFVPILDVTTTLILLVLISVYDFFAVIKSRFMVEMAKFQIKKVGIFSGFFVPYLTAKSRKMFQRLTSKKQDFKMDNKTAKKIPINVAILGGGDIAFPLIFAGVIFRTAGVLSALIVIAGAALGLLSLFIIGKKGKFYPAMPFITAGCVIGWLITLLI
jgi:presenilin-like A22 family membrane protease